MTILGTQPSKRWRLNLVDAGGGLVTGILTPVLLFVQQGISAGKLMWDWKGMVMTAIAGAVAYLTLQYFKGQPK